LTRAAHPTFKTYPPSRLEGREGSSLRLQCEAVGFPPPVITWSKNGQKIDERKVNHMFFLI